MVKSFLPSFYVNKTQDVVKGSNLILQHFKITNSALLSISLVIIFFILILYKISLETVSNGANIITTNTIQLY